MYLPVILFYFHLFTFIVKDNLVEVSSHTITLSKFLILTKQDTPLDLHNSSDIIKYIKKKYRFIIIFHNQIILIDPFELLPYRTFLLLNSSFHPNKIVSYTF